MLATETLRTSCALECAKLCSDFIALSGTLITNRSTAGLQEWISQLVDFEVTEKNYWVASAAMIAHKFQLTSVREVREVEEVEMTAAERAEYAGCVASQFGGSAKHTNFRAAIQVCYQIVERALVAFVLKCFDYNVNEKTDRVEILSIEEKKSINSPVFLIAKDSAMQSRLAERLEKGYGLRVFCITGQQSVDLKGLPIEQTMLVKGQRTAYAYDVIITTIRHSTGYTLTACDRMITSVYFSNQATRDQLEGRIARIGQLHEVIHYNVLHVGLLSYIWQHYEQARSMKVALEDLAKVMNISNEDMRNGF